MRKQQKDETVLRVVRRAKDEGRGVGCSSFEKEERNGSRSRTGSGSGSGSGSGRPGARERFMRGVQHAPHHTAHPRYSGVTRTEQNQQKLVISSRPGRLTLGEESEEWSQRGRARGVSERRGHFDTGLGKTPFACRSDSGFNNWSPSLGGFPPLFCPQSVRGVFKLCQYVIVLFY